MNALGGMTGKNRYVYCSFAISNMSNILAVVFHHVTRSKYCKNGQ